MNSANSTPAAGSALQDIISLVNNPLPSPAADTPRMLQVMPANDWLTAAANRPDPKPLWLSLWFEGEVCCLFSDSNLGKSLYAVQIGAEISRTNKVIYFDFELSDKAFQLRYTDDNGQLYHFPDNFYRSEIDPNNIPEGNFEEIVIEEIEHSVVETGARVIIIDNLTWLCMASEKGDAASVLMMRLRQLRDRHDLSILIVAHTPKRSLTSPITQNDLAGSKKLFNFFSSVFAIGKSAKDESLRYVKQIKTRAGAFEHGAENVIVSEIVKDGCFTRFQTIEYASEKEHLQEVSDSSRAQLTEDVRKYHDEGKSIREIATLLHISKSMVDRIIRKF